MPNCEYEYDLSGNPITSNGIGCGGYILLALGIIVAVIICGALYGLTDPAGVHALVP